MAVFSRLGFHNARMDDIVAESGLSKGSLYWYFKSKDEIILAILNSLFEREFAGLNEMLTAEGQTVRQRLENMVDHTISDIQHMLSLMPLTYEFYALAFRQKAVRQALKAYFQNYLQMMEPVVQEGIDQGEFQQVVARDVVIGLGAIIEGTVLLWIYEPDIVDPGYHARVSAQLFFDGLTVQNPQ